MQFVHDISASGWIVFVIARRKYQCILYQQVYIQGYILLQISTACRIFSAFLHRFSFFRFFMPFFQQFVPITDSVFFSICCMFYLHFLGTSFSKQWSLDVGERDVGSMSSTHCSNVLLCGLLTGNDLLGKYYIKLPRIFVIF